MIKEAIVKIVDKQDLTYDEAFSVMNEIMDGQTTQVQNAAFLAALSTKSTKSETIPEITGCAQAMRDHALQVRHDMEVMDIVGTGGDGSMSFNISTCSALVTAAAGIKVAKHGNRAASSLSGAADCFEALGVDIDQSPAKSIKLLRDVGMCFLFARNYHSSMRYVADIRKELGFRTVFNILGPLTNPASPTVQLLGVYDESLVEPLAKVLAGLGVRRGMVVYGTDKLDEISVFAPTKVCEFDEENFRSYELTPEGMGFVPRSHSELKGGDPAVNAAIALSILCGEKGAGRDAVLANAGAAIFLGSRTVKNGAGRGVGSVSEGIAVAAEMIDSGAAIRKLEQFREASQDHE